MPDCSNASHGTLKSSSTASPVLADLPALSVAPSVVGHLGDSSGAGHGHSKKQIAPRKTCTSSSTRRRARAISRKGSCADSRSTTAQLACERVLSLCEQYRGLGSDGDMPASGSHVVSQHRSASSSSDASLHKLAQHLPASIVDLLEVLGSARRLQRLITMYGGSNIRVPTVWAATKNPLHGVLGPRALKKFMEMYGGTDIYIPRCAIFVRHLRDAAISRDYAQLANKGSSLRQAVARLAVRYDLSDRQVRKILNTIP